MSVYLHYITYTRHLCFIVFVTVYRIDWCIDLFCCTAARVFNKLTYLLIIQCSPSTELPTLKQPQYSALIIAIQASRALQ